MSLCFNLEAIKQVKQNPNSAIRSDLDYGLGDLSSKQDRLASKTEVTTVVNRLGVDVANTQDATKEANQQAKSATIKSERADRNARDAIQQIRYSEMQLESLINTMKTKELRMAEAMMGNAEFRLDDGVLGADVSAAWLNSKVAGEAVLPLTVALVAKDPNGEDFVYPVHTWATGISSVFTAGNTGCWDAAVTYEDDPTSDLLTDGGVLNYGLIRATVTFLTDAGSTKIYVEGDTVIVKVKIEVLSPTRAWAVTEVTKTYTVVA